MLGKELLRLKNRIKAYADFDLALLQEIERIQQQLVALENDSQLYRGEIRRQSAELQKLIMSVDLSRIPASEPEPDPVPDEPIQTILKRRFGGK